MDSGPWLGFGDETEVAHWVAADGKLHHPEEDQAGAGGMPAIESENELVEVSLQVCVANRALMGAQQPSLDQGCDAVDPRQQ